MVFGEETQDSKDGSICNLSATHYLVDGSSGTAHESIITAWFSFYTGAGYNIIRRAALAPNWETQFDEKAAPPRLCDAN